MLYAINDLGEKILPTKDVSARCPCCESTVIPKMGVVNIHHWSHLSKEINCNYKPMGQWHYEWQLLFPKKNVEIYVNKRRRADVLTDDGISVEFQSSPISIEEIESRSQLSENKIIWVHNFIEQYEKNRFVNIKKSELKENLYHAEWLNPHKIFDRNRSLDIGIYFQFTERTLAKLCWIDYSLERTKISFYSIAKKEFVNFINDKCNLKK